MVALHCNALVHAASLHDDDDDDDDDEFGGDDDDFDGDDDDDDEDDGNDDDDDHPSIFHPQWFHCNGQIPFNSTDPREDSKKYHLISCASSVSFFFIPLAFLSRSSSSGSSRACCEASWWSTVRRSFCSSKSWILAM